MSVCFEFTINLFSCFKLAVCESLAAVSFVGTRLRMRVLVARGSVCLVRDAPRPSARAAALTGSVVTRYLFIFSFGQCVLSLIFCVDDV